MSTFHILNGDALKERFPTESISGKIIVTRECLVDGDVEGNTLGDIIETRVRSIHDMYGTSKEEYFQKAVPELNKIAALDQGEVNLWFEDDLFCQVNFWFVCSLIEGKPISAHLVRPENSLRYGFAGLNQQELVDAFEDRKHLTEPQIEQFTQLWRAYQKSDQKKLLATSKEMYADFPFLDKAIQAQIDRIPYGSGLPERTLKDIIYILSKEDFGPVFQEFSNQLPIYGFGDLQVKRMFDHLIKK